ncbi:MAG: ABC transporter permease [Planctomycetota bacterium]|nr:ABC transporter permease [Planctomycetota bacterium]
MLHSPFSRSVRLGVKSLYLHKLRSLLTTFGVLFGVSSVISMLAIGEGASEEAQEQIRQLGSQNVILRSLKPDDDPMSNQTTRSTRYGLTWSDYERVAETFPGLESVVPIRNFAQEVRFEDTVLNNATVKGTTAEYQKASGRLLHRGRFLSPLDDSRRSNVCVLGYEVARYFFAGEEALGRAIKIGPEYFEVVGIILPRVPIGSKEMSVSNSVTGEVFVPIQTGVSWFGDMNVELNSGSRTIEIVDLHELIAAVKDAESVAAVAAASRTMLERHHTLSDYEVIVPLELLARAEETKRIFNIVLGCIASISLLVGGIGIMNVMLATVNERTREIGIRRSLGAKRHHIMMQFLVETVVLSVGGGVLGIGLGVLVPYLVEHYAEMRTIVTLHAPFLAFGISVSIGLVFGLYPAWQAANLDPVEALRHE